jgi:hypothetical protein
MTSGCKSSALIRELKRIAAANTHAWTDVRECIADQAIATFQRQEKLIEELKVENRLLRDLLRTK